MTTPTPPRNRNDFKVAIFCALPVEGDAVQSVLDTCWEDVGKRYGKAAGDQNAYTTGAIGSHNVVLVHMPRMGVTSAATSAAGLRSSYTRIQLALVVGVCGVAPVHAETQEEIVLGDIIISTAVTQYDFGRQYPDGFQMRKEIDDSLGRAGPEVQAFVNMLQSRYSRQRLKKDLKQLLCSEEFQMNHPDAKYPGVAQDQLYPGSYTHQHRLFNQCNLCQNNLDICPKTCSELGCDKNQLIARKRHRTSSSTGLNNSSDNVPFVHFGRFGSANTVMKSGIDRDRIATAGNVIAFEMEGAGVWEQHQTIVIKAACDYADSHKNKKWQPYAAKMAAAFLQVFLKEWVTSDEMPDADEVPEGPWHVPFDHVSGFVGRTEELSRIKEKVLGVNSRRVVSILGLGGVGKSRLTLELIYQIRAEHPDYAIFWIQGATQSTFENDLLDIGRKLNLKGINEDKADVKTLVKQKLGTETDYRWIMILDNADDEDLWGPKQSSAQTDSSLAGYLPRSTSGSIVVTTRTRRVATFLAGKDVLGLSDLPMEQAVEMLRDGLENPGLLDGDEIAQTLVDRLGCLPLAIVQAISFINHTQEPASTYMRLLDQPEERIVELLSKDFEEASGYQQTLHPVATTWLISFEQIRKKHALAARYLTYMACLLEKNIPLSILPSNDSSEKLEAIAVLAGYSFVKRQAIGLDPAMSEPLYDMHRLVRLCTRNWLRKEGLLETETMECIRSVSKLFPPQRHEFKDKTTIFLPHSQCLITEPCAESVRERYELMYLIANFLFDVGRAREALKLNLVVAQWTEKVLGPHDRFTLMSFRGTGLAMMATWDLAKSETWLRRAIDGQGASLGWEHWDTLVSISNLANVHRMQGRLDEAEKLQHHVLESKKKVVGVETPDVLWSMNSLADIYFSQGRWSEAELLQLQVLEGKKKLLKPEHPDILWCMNGLAETYLSQGRNKSAENLQTQVLESRTRVLGEDHPNTLVSLGNLANVYRIQGRLQEAEKLQLQTLERRTRVLGPDHSDSVASMTNLANVYFSQGRWEEAEKLQLQVLERGAIVSGAEHPDILRTKGNLGYSYFVQGRLDEALEVQLQVLESRKKVIGMEHPDTLLSIDHVANTYQSQGRWNEAERFRLRALDCRKRTIGLEHPSTVTTMSNLGLLYQQQRRWDEAEKLQLQALEINTKIRGLEHSQTVDITGALAHTYWGQVRWEEAEALLLKVLESTRRTSGEHVLTVGRISTLAEFYSQQNRWEKAAKLQREAFEMGTRVSGAEHRSTLSIMSSLAVSLQSLGQYEEAKNLMKSCLDLRRKVLGPDDPATLWVVDRLKEWQQSRSTSWTVVDPEISRKYVARVSRPAEQPRATPATPQPKTDPTMFALTNSRHEQPRPERRSWRNKMSKFLDDISRA